MLLLTLSRTGVTYVCDLSSGSEGPEGNCPCPSLGLGDASWEDGRGEREPCATSMFVKETKAPGELWKILSDHCGALPQ